jgi:hypothetical protein
LSALSCSGQFKVLDVVVFGLLMPSSHHAGVTR